LAGQLWTVHVGERSQPHVETVAQQRQVGIKGSTAVVLQVFSGAINSIDHLLRNFGLHWIVVRSEKVKLALLQVDWFIEAKRRQEGVVVDKLLKNQLQIDWVSTNGTQN